MANNKDFKVKKGLEVGGPFTEGLGTVTTSTSYYSIDTAFRTGVAFNFQTQVGTSLGSDFSDDGYHFYVIGNDELVYQYDMTTAWDLTTASYASKTANISTQVAAAGYGFRFGDSGSKFYVADAGEVIYQYNLTTAYDVSTASYASKSFDATTPLTRMYDFTFSADGTTIVLCGTSGNTTYRQIASYTLSTAWDISTMSYDGDDHAIDTEFDIQSRSPRNVGFNSDGTKLFSGTTRQIRAYNLGTAYDLSTVDYSTKDVSGKASSWESDGTYAIAQEFVFSSDGSKMFARQTAFDNIFEINTTLTTYTCDLSTGSVFEIDASASTSGSKIAFSNPPSDGEVGTAVVIFKNGGSNSAYSISQYNFVSGNEGSLEDVFILGRSTNVGTTLNNSKYLYVHPEGKNVYFAGNGDRIYDLELENPYFMHTAYHDPLTSANIDSNTPANGGSARVIDISAITSASTTPTGIFFSPDGSYIFIADGGSSERVLRLDLGEPWNFRTVSFDSSQEASVSSVVSNTTVRDLFFSPDGLNMYLVESLSSNSEVHQWNLSTAWDISSGSISYDQNFVLTEGVSAATPEMLCFSPDGKKMFVGDNNIYEYDLTTAWDIGTATFRIYTSQDDDVTATPEESFRFFGPANSHIVMNDNTSLQDLRVVRVRHPIPLIFDDSIEIGKQQHLVEVGASDVLSFTTTDGGTTYSMGTLMRMVV